MLIIFFQVLLLFSLNSLNSFETAFSNLQQIIEQSYDLTALLVTELEEEHSKAKKYLGKV